MSLDVYLETPMCTHCRRGPTEVYGSNITHNLGAMAKEAGIYEHLWFPDKLNIEKALELIEPLRAALALLKSDPERFKKHDASNGWGTYEHFVPFVEQYLQACEENQNAEVRVSR